MTKPPPALGDSFLATLSRRTHIWPGCWFTSTGDWVHAWSDDLVHWTLGAYANLGNSGAVGVDEKGGVFAVSAGLQAFPSTSADLEKWGAPSPAFDSNWMHGPGDPPRPWQEADGTWRAAVCGTNCVQSGAYPCPNGSLADLWETTGTSFAGPWQRAPSPLWATNQTLFAWLDDDRELVTPDFVPSIPGDASGKVRALFNNQCGTPMCEYDVRSSRNSPCPCAPPHCPAPVCPEFLAPLRRHANVFVDWWATPGPSRMSPSPFSVLFSLLPNTQTRRV